MSEADVSAAVRAALAEHGRLTRPAEEIREDDDLYALGLSSHATVNVVMALEDSLDVEIPDELLTKSTFASISALRAALAAAVA